ncbi:ribosome biogenesis GTPase YqeH [Atopobacter phocae]|uniref:ribosome biogenesis GTPase YqeH n=1 Tax=Atopobacter phocae TaxID=136492 RepID=UPI0004705044|nr:ribosome biogenesis GTPase YqeH [Atopobacter phocae]
MVSIINDLSCIGCGAKIQVEDREAPGYVKGDLLARTIESQSKEMYCERCFRLRHYNEIAPVSLTDDDFLELLNDIGQKDALVVYVLDILDLYGTQINGLQRFIGNNPVLVVLNKLDLLPVSTNKNRLEQVARHLMKEQGLSPVGVALISAEKRHGIDDLMEQIEVHRKEQSVYVVGVTNVGKSTIINRIIGAVSDEENPITTSYYPGTTLGRIEIPLADGESLIDTPGIIQPHQLAHALTADELKMIIPRKRLKPVTYQLNSGQTLFIGGIARIDVTNKKKGSLTTYLPNQLMIHRTKTAKADQFFEKHVGEMLQPPVNRKNIKLVMKQFKVPAKSDIVISGLGWITFHHEAEVSVWTIEGNDVFLRPALIGK